MLFPPRCASCGTGAWPLCLACAARIAVATPPACERCDRPWEEPVVTCTDCPPPEIDAARAPFVYEGPVARAIRALKFSGWRALAPSLAGAMVEGLSEVHPVEGFAPDVVTWVSLSGKRRGRRGFDQAEVLSRLVAGRLGLEVASLLARVRDTPAQATRTGRERRASLRGAFAVTETVPPSVLLVDDVLTTGATASACARALRDGGAGAVVLLVAARSCRGPVPARCYGGQKVARTPQV
jgi:ComF family protein